MLPKKVKFLFFTSEHDWEALAFPKDYSSARNHFYEEREILITPSEYVHAWLKCCDDRFSANPQYICHALDCIQRNAVASSIHLAEREQLQSEINIGQLMSKDSVKLMISDDQILSYLKTSEELFNTFTMCP